MPSPEDPDPAPVRPGETLQPLPDRCDASLVFIGVIRTPWREPRDCPRRGDLEGPDCRIDVDPLWEAALEDLRPGATLQILYWMHRGRRDLVRQRPRSRPAAVGTFALRSPMRPNPIASSSVRLVGRQGPALTVRGLDCVDGTPLLDIKPDRCPVLE